MSKYSERIAMGLCGYCGKRPATFNGRACEECRVRKLENRRAWYGYRVEGGQCVMCGKIAQEGKVMCRSCTLRSANDNRLKYERKKARGVCGYCGGEKEDGRVLCAACRAKNRERIERHKRGLMGDGPELQGRGREVPVLPGAGKAGDTVPVGDGGGQAEP